MQPVVYQEVVVVPVRMSADSHLWFTIDEYVASSYKAIVGPSEVHRLHPSRMQNWVEVLNQPVSWPLWDCQ